jgi:hypothetical protein
MKTRPASFLHDPHLMSLRNQLAEVCTEALAIAKLPRTVGGSTYEATYDFNKPEYTKLLFKREMILGKIKAYWNGEK